MKLLELNSIEKLYFGYEEIARVLHISGESAKVAASRYTRQGLLVRIKKNMYVLRSVWEGAGVEIKFALANLGQVPSYISLTTALVYYGITTQVQREFFESVAVKRTKEISIGEAVFRYVRIAGDLYFGFKKEKGFFIATPEKALLDGFYLMSFGRYAMDVVALDPTKLDGEELARLSSRFPMRTQNMLRKHGYLKTT